MLLAVLSALQEWLEQVLQSLLTSGQMLAAIAQLQPPQVILFWFLGCSRG